MSLAFHDPSVHLMNHVNIAVMSDSQFRESLDALLDTFSDNTMTTPTTPPLSPPVEVVISSPPPPLTTTGSSSSCISVQHYSGSFKPYGNSSEAISTTTLQQDSQYAAFQNPSSYNRSTTAQPLVLGGCGGVVVPPVAMLAPPVLPYAATTVTTNMNVAIAAPPPMFPTTPFLVARAAARGAFGHAGQQHVFSPVMIPSMLSSNGAIVATGMPAAPNISLAAAAAKAPGRKEVPTNSPRISSSTTTASMDDSSSRKRARGSPFAISEDGSTQVNIPGGHHTTKRRADRNAREQQRAQQVTDQIALLRALLEQSGIALNKADKFSTLITVEQYIRQLQLRSVELATEHQQLLSTLQQTTELVHSQYNNNVAQPPPNAVSSSSSGSGSGSEESASRSSEPDDDEVSLRGALKELDYKWIFASCPFAVAVASIDGRFLDCNREFEELTGYSRTELLPMEHHNDKGATTSNSSCNSAQSPAQPETKHKKHNMSIFNVLHRECIERLFCPMSKILRFPNSDDDDDKDGNANESNNSCNSTEDDGEDKDTITQQVQLCKRTNHKVRQSRVDGFLMKAGTTAAHTFAFFRVWLS